MLPLLGEAGVLLANGTTVVLAREDRIRENPQWGSEALAVAAATLAAAALLAPLPTVRRSRPCLKPIDAKLVVEFDAADSFYVDASVGLRAVLVVMR